MSLVNPEDSTNSESLLIKSQDWQPALDIYKTPEGWLLKMEIAGIRTGDTRIEVAHNLLHIHGRRQDTLIQQEWVHFAMEILYRDFERWIALPLDLSQATIDQEYKDGMLCVRIKTQEAAQS